MTTTISPPPQWSRRRAEKARRLDQVQSLADGVVLPSERIVEALELLIAPGDRVVLEGNNQKQADFLSRSLAKADPGKLHDLHMIMPSVSRAEHLDLFERQIARKLDFSFAGPQSLRISQLLEDGLLEVGAIHTYIELYSRLLVDLIPNVALVVRMMLLSWRGVRVWPWRERWAGLLICDRACASTSASMKVISELRE